MIVLAIWLFLAGYTIAIAGKRNLGVSYKPQSDGSIKAVDSKGGDAKTYSLMDVITCGDASVSVQGQPSPLATNAPARPSGTPPPTTNPNPLANPALDPLTWLKGLPAIKPPAVPRVPVPAPLPKVAPPDAIDSFVQDVTNGLRSLVDDARNALSHVRQPAPTVGLIP